MQNAKHHHVLQAHSFTPPLNAMFIVEHPEWGNIKAHIKGVAIEGSYFTGLHMESAEGSRFFAESEWLKPVPRKLGTPAKEKRKPQKRNKPWLAKFEYIDYDPKLIAPGVKVKCRDKRVRVVGGILSGIIVEFEDGFWVNLCNGMESSEAEWTSRYDIMKILAEKNVVVESVHNDDLLECNPWLKLLDKRYSKCQGYAPNVWHFWQGLSDKPPVDGDVKVQYWMRSDKHFDTCAEDRAKDLRWKWCDHTNNGDIIAFRIVE